MLGLSRGEHGLVLCVEDAEHVDKLSLEVFDCVVNALAVNYRVDCVKFTG